MNIKQKFANYLGYTDINPYEVVKVISDKCIEIREMSAEKIKWDMKIYQGGFSHHVANQDDQKWDITSNEANPIVRIRLNKSGQQYDHATKSYKPCYDWKDKYYKHDCLWINPKVEDRWTENMIIDLCKRHYRNNEIIYLFENEMDARSVLKIRHFHIIYKLDYSVCKKLKCKI